MEACFESLDVHKRLTLSRKKTLTAVHFDSSIYSDSLAFATEPVMGSLANILGCLEDRLPQTVAQETREYEFLDIEYKYGLLQLTEALLFLHYNCKIIHRNVCPSSVIVNKKGTWKLAGLEFSEKCNETDPMVSRNLIENSDLFITIDAFDSELICELRN